MTRGTAGGIQLFTPTRLLGGEDSLAKRQGRIALLRDSLGQNRLRENCRKGHSKDFLHGYLIGCLKIEEKKQKKTLQPSTKGFLNSVF